MTKYQITQWSLVQSPALPSLCFSLVTSSWDELYFVACIIKHVESVSTDDHMLPHSHESLWQLETLTTAEHKNTPVPFRRTAGKQTGFKTVFRLSGKPVLCLKIWLKAASQDIFLYPCVSQYGKCMSNHRWNNPSDVWSSEMSPTVVYHMTPNKHTEMYVENKDLNNSFCQFLIDRNHYRNV